MPPKPNKPAGKLPETTATPVVNDTEKAMPDAEADADQGAATGGELTVNGLMAAIAGDAGTASTATTEAQPEPEIHAQPEIEAQADRPAANYAVGDRVLYLGRVVGVHAVQHSRRAQASFVQIVGHHGWLRFDQVEPAPADPAN